ARGARPGRVSAALVAAHPRAGARARPHRRRGRRGPGPAPGGRPPRPGGRPPPGERLPPPSPPPPAGGGAGRAAAGPPRDRRAAPRAAAGERAGRAGRPGPRSALDAAPRRAVRAYLAVAGRETHASAVEDRRRLLDRSGCFRCHPHDTDGPPPLEQANSTLGASGLESVPFQRTPRLTGLLQKYTRAHLRGALREGVSGLRPARYTYRMPAFGPAAGELLQALCALDGELPDEADPPERAVTDPTVGTVAGLELAGFQGYACVSCHA